MSTIQLPSRGVLRIAGPHSNRAPEQDTFDDSDTVRWIRGWMTRTKRMRAHVRQAELAFTERALLSEAGLMDGCDVTTADTTAWMHIGKQLYLSDKRDAWVSKRSFLLPFGPDNITLFRTLKEMQNHLRSVSVIDVATAFARAWMVRYAAVGPHTARVTLSPAHVARCLTAALERTFPTQRTRRKARTAMRKRRRRRRDEMYVLVPGKGEYHYTELSARVMLLDAWKDEGCVPASSATADKEVPVASDPWLEGWMDDCM